GRRDAFARPLGCRDAVPGATAASCAGFGNGCVGACALEAAVDRRVRRNPRRVSDGACARLLRRFEQELQGHLQIAAQRGPMYALERLDASALLPVGRRPDDAGGTRRATGPRAGKRARTLPRRAQRTPLRQWLLWPRRRRRRAATLPRRASGSLPYEPRLGAPGDPRWIDCPWLA